jgi:F-box-like
VLFFTNTAQYSERSRTSLTFLPASPLAPIERALLESVIEFRNVVELDTWLPSESIEKLSLSDLAKSVTPQVIPSPNLAASQKRKVQDPEVGAPLFGKVRSYFNKLPSFSSVFSSQVNTPPPPPPRSRPTSPSPLHLLFNTPAYLMNDQINRLPYEILVHIFKYMRLEDVRPCSLICHRAWQVINCDLVWRELMAHAKRERERGTKWEKYASFPNYTTTEPPYATYRHPPFIPNTQFSAGLAISRDSSKSNSTSSIFNVLNEAGQEPTAERRRESLKSLLDTIEGYARFVLSHPFSLLTYMFCF